MIISDYFKTAHEVKNTISLANANLDLLELNELNEARIRKYRLIKNELNRIHDLMMELLRFARDEDAPKERLNPRSILRELVYEFYESFHYTFDFKFDPPAHEVFILGNKPQIRQVFTNIFKNAVEASEENSRLKLVIKIEEEDSFVKITIRDNGKGFLSQDTRWEEKDYPEPQENTTKKDICGLGLIIAKSIVTEHNGTLEIQSETGIGTSVFIKLPAYLRGER